MGLNVQFYSQCLTVALILCRSLPPVRHPKKTNQQTTMKRRGECWPEKQLQKLPTRRVFANTVVTSTVWGDNVSICLNIMEKCKKVKLQLTAIWTISFQPPWIFILKTELTTVVDNMITGSDSPLKLESFDPP